MDPLPDQFRVDIPNDITAPGHARREVERRMSPRAGDAVRDAQLVASELVTNAWRHGGGIRWFAICEADRSIRVEVADSSNANAELVEPTDDGGFGLHIVDELSEDWGVVFDALGKIVWSTVRNG